MRRAVPIFLLLTALASAQSIIPAADLARVLPRFAPHPDEQPLRCDVTPAGPGIDFAFRIEAGYTFQVPQSQYPTPTIGWTVLLTITPEHGDPTYLVARTPLARATVSNGRFQIRGGYLLGPGRYSVDAALRDDRHRVCRQRWRVVVAPSRADRAVPLATPPGAVRMLTAVRTPEMGHPDDAAPMRATILLNAAAFSTRRTVIRDRDRTRMVDALTALVEHLPASSLRVVVFSLEQRKEIFRDDTFQPSDAARIAGAIDVTPQATIDVGLLKNPFGYVDFLGGLIRRELAAQDPTGTLIFFGPTSRYWDAGPKSTLPAAPDAHARVFYVRYEAFQRPMIIAQPLSLPTRNPTTGEAVGTVPIPPSDPMHGQPDIVTKAVAQLGGKTILVHSPAELAGAIRKIEGRR